jgi:hypothetical protein
MALIKIQTVKQNSGNWKYNLKGEEVYINPNYIKKVMVISEGVFGIFIEGDDRNYPITIDQKQLDEVLK